MPRLCTFSGCGRPFKGRGLCSGHLEQSRQGSSLREIKSRRPHPPNHRNDLGEKECSECRTYQPEDQFYSRREAPDGLTLSCKICSRSRARAVRYNVPMGYLEGLLASQEGRCASCKSLLVQWEVDHDHRCCPGRYSCGSCIRGILCHSCNSTLGAAQDDPNILRSTLLYLEGK